MTKTKPHVKPYSSRKKADAEAAKKGKSILNDSEAVVLYKGKKWVLSELVQHLARKVYELERNQCKPSAKCLFEGREYLEKKYLGRSYDPSDI